MDGAATAAIAWLSQREGSWGMGTRWPAPRSSCYKCALCHAVLQRSIPSCPYILLYERALSSSVLCCTGHTYVWKRGWDVAQNTARKHAGALVPQRAGGQDGLGWWVVQYLQHAVTTSPASHQVQRRDLGLLLRSMAAEEGTDQRVAARAAYARHHAPCARIRRVRLCGPTGCAHARRRRTPPPRAVAHVGFAPSRHRDGTMAITARLRSESQAPCAAHRRGGRKRPHGCCHTVSSQ